MNFFARFRAFQNCKEHFCTMPGKKMALDNVIFTVYKNPENLKCIYFPNIFILLLLYIYLYFLDEKLHYREPFSYLASYKNVLYSFGKL